MKLRYSLFANILFCGLAMAERPNVLVLFIDDLGFTDVGINGSTFYKTPNIDRLANSGANFSHAYSAHPVCSPTRAALMSGKAPQRVGITQWIAEGTGVHLALEELTLGEAMREGGYFTGYIGKWHLGEASEFSPDKQGFEWVRAVNHAGQPASYFYPYAGKQPKNSDVPDLGRGKQGDYLTDSLTDLAIEFVDKQEDKPFFLCLAHYAVHTPIQAPEPLVKSYRQAAGEKYGAGPTPTREERYASTTRARQDDPGFAAMVENLDTNIGRLVAHLETSGKLDNTLVVFTSDNGGLSTLTRGPGPTSNLPLRAGKGWNYEGGIRIPTFFYWKGKIAPRRVDTPAITTDLYPTILDLAGLPAKPEQHLDGRSLASAIRGEPSDELQSRHLGWSYPHNHGSGHKPSNAILQGDWKLIRFEAGKRFELYHLAEDPGESNDLAEQQPEKVQALDALLTQWLQTTSPTR